MIRNLLTGIVTLAVAVALTFPASAGTSGGKEGNKPVQAQTSSCKCDKKKVKAAKKKCNCKKNCDCKKKPCPKDCPKSTK